MFTFHPYFAHKSARFLLIIGIFMLSVNKVWAQEKKPLFLGIQPAVTKEQFYDAGEFDINIIPIVLQMPLSKKFDLRLTTLGNYHFGGTEGFSDLGLQAVVPYFIFSKKEKTNSKSHGFYAGPVLGFGRNLLNDHYTTTLGIEPGYMFETEKHFTLSLGLQFGGSYFTYDDQSDIWRNHFGFKLNLGWWL